MMTQFNDMCHQTSVYLNQNIIKLIFHPTDDESNMAEKSIMSAMFGTHFQLKLLAERQTAVNRVHC